MEKHDHSIEFLVQVTETVTTLRFMTLKAPAEFEAEEEARSLVWATTGDVIERRTEAVSLNSIGRSSTSGRCMPKEVTWGGVRCIQVTAAACEAGLTHMEVAITLDAWGEHVVPSHTCSGFTKLRLWDILHACSLSFKPEASSYAFEARIRGNTDTAELAQFRAISEAVGDLTRLLITTMRPSRKLHDAF